MRRPHLPRMRSCLRCPFRAPSGKCLAPGLKSGRCGDWVFYLRDGKQQRHLYVKPKDPRTPRQRLWRARFSAASKKYSYSLTEEQRDACIAAGAKLQSRLRLGQSGPLTGQQYSIRSEYAAKAKENALSAEKAQKALQTKGVSLSTSDPRRGISGVPPGQRHRNTRRAGKSEGTRKNEEGGRWNAMAAPELLQPHRLARSRGVRNRNTPRAVRWQGASWKSPGSASACRVLIGRSVNRRRYPVGLRAA